MTTFSDNFDRANVATLGANWTETAASWQILSNQADSNTASDHLAWFNTPCAGANNFTQATLRGNLASVACRGNGAAVGSDTSYQVTGFGSLWRLRKRVAGVFTTLGSDYATTPVLGDVFYVEANGSTIKGKINGVERWSVTDTSITVGTSCGLWSTDASSAWDDFSGGDLGAPPLIGHPRVWSGSAWVAATDTRVWSGSAWVSAVGVKVWNGSAWVDTVP